MARRSWGCNAIQQRRCVGVNLSRLGVIGILLLDLLGLQALELFLLHLLGWGFVLCCLVHEIQANTDADAQHPCHNVHNQLALLWVQYPVSFDPCAVFRVLDLGLDIHIRWELRVTESPWWCCNGRQTLIADREGVEHYIRVVPKSDRGLGQERTIRAREKVQGGLRCTSYD